MIYLSVCNCFSFNTVRTRVGLPSPDGPEALLSLILLCDPDSLPESVKLKKYKKKKEKKNGNQNNEKIQLKCSTDFVKNSEKKKNVNFLTYSILKYHISIAHNPIKYSNRSISMKFFLLRHNLKDIQRHRENRTITPYSALFVFKSTNNIVAVESTKPQNDPKKTNRRNNQNYVEKTRRNQKYT